MRFSKLEKITILSIIVIALLIVQPFAPADYHGPEYLDPPIQQNLPQSETWIIEGRKGPVTIELVATYQMQAGVRGRRNYRFDVPAQVSPMDLILAWGDLNQNHMLEAVRYRQSGRWYYFTVKPESEVTNTHVSHHSANTHIIPADDKVLKELKSVKTNSYVELTGYLVNVNFEDGPWRTSLTRIDTGSGACEIFLVTHAFVQNRSLK